MDNQAQSYFQTNWLLHWLTYPIPAAVVSVPDREDMKIVMAVYIFEFESKFR